MPVGGYWKGVWKCRRCGTKLDRPYVICDDCVREIFEKEVPQSSIRQVAKKYGIHYVTLSNRARKIFS